VPVGRVLGLINMRSSWKHESSVRCSRGNANIITTRTSQSSNTAHSTSDRLSMCPLEQIHESSCG